MLLDATAALLTADSAQGNPGLPPAETETTCDAPLETVPPDNGDGTNGTKKVGVPEEVASASEVEEAELVLLDLLHAPVGSYLYSLATVLVRIETLSHICAWAKFDETIDLSLPTAITQNDVCIVSLQRLKLTFQVSACCLRAHCCDQTEPELRRTLQARRVGETVRLFSVDHGNVLQPSNPPSEKHAL